MDRAGCHLEFLYELIYIASSFFLCCMLLCLAENFYIVCALKTSQYHRICDALTKLPTIKVSMSFNKYDSQEFIFLIVQNQLVY